MNTSSPPKPAFLAFATGEKDLAALKAFAGAHGWGEGCVLEGDIAQAATHLKTNPSPQLLLAEIPSSAQAQELLNQLADVCDPETKVIITGTVNEYSFYCWLMDIGISSYLLKPLEIAALEQAYAKAMAPPAPAAEKSKAPARLIGVTGTRGGVGATSVAIYVSALLAQGKLSTALIDLDPQDGSVALLLDLEPARGLREAMERPDRIDNLFLDRVMHKTAQGVAVLSAEESLAERVQFHDHAADALLNELREKFAYVVLDLPRQAQPFYRTVAKACDTVLAVTDLSLSGLRDAIRLSDLYRDQLKLKPPVFVANRLGMTPKFELPVADFEKGVKDKLAHRIPFAPDIFMAVTGDLPGLKSPSPALKALHALAQHIAPELEAESAPAEAKHALLGFLKKGK